MRTTLLTRLSIPFALGMAGACFVCPHANVMPVAIVCVVEVIALAFLNHIPTSTFYSTSAKKMALGIGTQLFVFTIAICLYCMRHQHIATGVPHSACTGILCDLPQEKAKSIAITLEQSNGTKFILYVKKSAQLPTMDIGDTITASPTHINCTDPCKNDPDGAFTPFYKSLFNNGICATAYTTPQNIAVLPCSTTPPFTARLRGIQHTLHNLYKKKGITDTEGAIIEAMTIGRKADLDSDTRHHFVASGVSHILALSGFHVGFIIVILQIVFLARLIPYRWRWICNIFIIMSLWAFAIIAGMSPSLMRATIMSTILLVFQSFGIPLLSLHSCALAAFIMLGTNPLNISNIGFQLSFVSVLSIAFLGRKTPWPLLTIPLICTLATLPIVAYHFGNVPTLSVLTNVMITPFVLVTMGASTLLWASIWNPTISTAIADMLLLDTKFINRITTWVSSLPFSTIDWHPSIAGVFAYYALIVVFLNILKKHRKRVSNARQ